MLRRIEVRREVIVFYSGQNRSSLITLLKALSVTFLLSLSMEIPQPVLIFVHVVKERIFV